MFSFLGIFMVFLCLMSISIFYNTFTYGYIDDTVKCRKVKKNLKTALRIAFEDYSEELERRKEESGYIDKEAIYSSGYNAHNLPLNDDKYFSHIYNIDSFIESTPIEFDMAAIFFKQNNIDVLDKHPCDIYDIVQFFVAYRHCDEDYKELSNKVTSSNITQLYHTLTQTGNALYFISGNDVTKMAEMIREIMVRIDRKTVFDFKSLKESVTKEKNEIILAEKSRVKNSDDKNSSIFKFFNNANNFLNTLDYKYYMYSEKLYNNCISNKNIFRFIFSALFFALFTAADGLRTMLIILPSRLTNSIIYSFLDKTNLKYYSSDSPANMIFNIAIFPYMKQYA